MGTVMKNGLSLISILGLILILVVGVLVRNEDTGVIAA